MQAAAPPLPDCFLKTPAGTVFELVQQIADSERAWKDSLNCVLEIVLAQPVRHDSPIDQFGEALVGHSVLDWVKDCHRVQKALLRGDSACQRPELVPVMIGKVELQPKEHMKGRWPGIFVGPYSGFLYLQHTWTGKLYKVLPWVSKSWNSRSLHGLGLDDAPQTLNPKP